MTRSSSSVRRDPMSNYDHDIDWVSVEDPLIDQWEAEFKDHQDWMAEQEQDRLIRHGGDTYVVCVLCDKRSGKTIYGGKCQQCFEDRREEREAA